MIVYEISARALSEHVLWLVIVVHKCLHNDVVLFGLFAILELKLNLHPLASLLLHDVWSLVKIVQKRTVLGSSFVDARRDIDDCKSRVGMDVREDLSLLASDVVDHADCTYFVARLASSTAMVALACHPGLVTLAPRELLGTGVDVIRGNVSAWRWVKQSGVHEDCERKLRIQLVI